MKTILEITNQTPTERNDMLFKAFLFWAGKHTYTRTQLQVAITSKAIKKWFFTEYEKNEKEFLILIARIGEGTVDDNNVLYNRMMEKIYDIYPGVFLTEILDGYPEITDKCLN